MLLFDAHAQLAAPDFADDLSDVLTRAESAGLCGVLTVGETPADAERILDLAAGHRLIKPADSSPPPSPETEPRHKRHKTHKGVIA